MVHPIRTASQVAVELSQCSIKPTILEAVLIVITWLIVSLTGQVRHVRTHRMFNKGSERFTGRFAYI